MVLRTVHYATMYNQAYRHSNSQIENAGLVGRQCLVRMPAGSFWLALFQMVALRQGHYRLREHKLKQINVVAKHDNNA